MREVLLMDDSRRYITKIAREAGKLTIQQMKENGVGSGEFDLIHLVRHHPGISQKDAGQTLNMEKGAVARRAARLEEKGYLIRRENPSDARSRLLFATEKADTLKSSKTTVEMAFYDWLLEDLPAEERNSFLYTLEGLYKRSKQESRSGFPHVKERLYQTGGGQA